MDSSISLLRQFLEQINQVGVIVYLPREGYLCLSYKGDNPNASCRCLHFDEVMGCNPEDVLFTGI